MKDLHQEININSSESIIGRFPSGSVGLNGKKGRKGEEEEKKREPVAMAKDFDFEVFAKLENLSVDQIFNQSNSVYLR